MMRLAAILSLALVALPLSAARVLIVLDVSGSMRAAAGDVSRMEAAQRAVRATVEAIDPGSNVALRLYGHRLPSEPKAASCRDTELVIPFGPLDRQKFISAVTNARPLGQTPLAFSLEQAAADFGQIGSEQVAIILVSDGEESCGGDPAKVACALRERGLELTVHTVGFDVNAIARQQLQAVASCTGGQYRDARNAGELAESLRQLTQAGLLVDKKREVRNVGNVVRGGDGFSSAVPIAPGTYRLDHHQRAKEFDYFVIDVKPGFILRASQETAPVGVTIEGDKITENSYPTAGVTLYAPDQTVIGEDAKVGAGQRATVTTSVAAGKGGRYFVLVGQRYWDWGTSTESPFTIELIDATDAGSGTDAGTTTKEAVLLKAGKHRAWAQTADSRDTFWFDAAPGQAFQLRARPDGEIHFQLSVEDEDGVQLASEFAPNTGAAVRIAEIKPQRAGRLYATVHFINTGEPIGYEIELTSAGAASTPVATSTTAATAASEARRGFFSWIPGGGYTCAGVVLFFLLLLVLLIVFVVRLFRKRS